MMTADLELLAECVPLAQQLAYAHCTAAPQGRSCVHTHAAWPAARLVGLVASPSQDAPFWRDACSRIPAVGDRLRVLVSGAADHGIAEVALSALGSRSQSAEITVIDRCETPLKINQWYATRAGHVLETHCCDILAFDPDTRFDVVCSHGFIDQLAPDKWPLVIAQWHRLLRPGGIAIAINRLAPPDRVNAAVQAPDLPAMIAAANRGLSPIHQLPLQPTCRILELYWAHRRQAGFRSAAQITALYEQAGLRIEQAVETSIEVGASRRASPRLQLVARRT